MKQESWHVSWCSCIPDSSSTLPQVLFLEKKFQFFCYNSSDYSSPVPSHFLPAQDSLCMYNWAWCFCSYIEIGLPVDLLLIQVVNVYTLNCKSFQAFLHHHHHLRRRRRPPMPSAFSFFLVLSNEFGQQLLYKYAGFKCEVFLIWRGRAKNKYGTQLLPCFVFFSNFISTFYLWVWFWN